MRKTAVINEFSIETIRDVLEKLQKFPDFKVNGLNAYQLEEIRSLDALLFREIGENIKCGRWAPFTGMWCDCEEADDCALVRHALYSSDYFKKNFNIESRVFFADKIHTNNFAQILYRNIFDAAFVAGESGKYWLDSADGSRILVCGRDSLDICDANDLDDEEIENNEFTTVEQEIADLLGGKLELESKSQPAVFSEPDETEKALIEAEKAAVCNGADRQEEIKKAWIAIFLGDGKSARETADNILKNMSYEDGFVKIDSDEVELEALKFTEDKSGEAVMRLIEKSGREKTIFVMADKLNAGFRCEIIPYEIQTFRIDKSGFVTETMINEFI